MFISLIVLAGGILVTAIVLLRRSIDLRYGSIDLIRWHVGFVGLYLGGGGLWALVSMNDEAYQRALGYYEIDASGVWLAAAAWVIALLFTYLCIRWLPCVVDLRQMQASANSDGASRVGVPAIGLLLMLGLLIGYGTGYLGYMGQRVGDESSEFRISPVFDVILALFPAFAAWNARRVFGRRVALGALVVGGVGLALVVPLGRRLFLATALTALALAYCHDPKVSLRRAAIMVLLGAFSYLALIVFFNLRQAEEAKANRSVESRTDLLVLLPDALSLTFSAPDGATKEVASLRKDNESSRPFFTLGFLIYCAQGYSEGLGHKGMVTLSGLVVAVPSVLMPGKDAFLEEYQEEERFIERDFKIPIKLDGSPTLPVSGLINLGLLGVALQVALFSVSMFLCLILLRFISGTPFAIIGVVYLVLSLQLAEVGSASLFIRLRLILILATLGWIWLAALGGRGRSVPLNEASNP